MLVDVLMIVAGIVILFFGGEWLVRGASLLAMRLGIPPVVIGVTIVAIGTSTPELVVSLKAAIDGANDIALGNIVGSNIANILLILGVCAVIRAMSSVESMVKVHIPIMIAVSITLMVMMMWDGELGRLDSFVLLAGMVGYILYTVYEARSEGGSDADDSAYEMPEGRGVWYFGMLIIAGLGLLMFGARLLVTGAVSLARDAGISEAFIGLTIVAVGTSLPELTTSVIAAVKRAGDIAIGNIVGSNSFNILFILGLTGSINPLVSGGVTHIDMWVMLAAALMLFLVLAVTRKISRISGAVMLAGYCGYTVWLAGNL